MKRARNCVSQKIVLTVVLVFCGLIGEIPIIAKENNGKAIEGMVYEVTENNDFQYSDSDKSKKSAEDNSLGLFSIHGKLSNDGSKQNYYICEGDDISFQYTVNSDRLIDQNEDWHIVSSKSKAVNGLDIYEKAESGALIVQTSRDGENWIADFIKTDIFKNNKKLKKPFYNTKSIQLDNGCYYKVTVAYTLQRKNGTKRILFFDKDENETKQIVESYVFHLQSDEDNSMTIESAPKKEFSTTVNTGKDNGFSQKNPIGNRDPHFGWNIGYFTINGYTRETNYEGTPIYLKNYGDKVTLWYSLTQDINQLNGDNTLIVSDDKNGYDNDFKIQKTDFGRGTLLIRYTDENGNIHDPIIYTNFLAANATLTADTKVQLFEEGDYEIALDYEIEEKSGPGLLKKTYYNYKTAFSFKIRNGNNMIFPFDIKSGNELSHNSLTSEGFRLDLAQSKYLTIDVAKSNLKIGKNHLLTEDIRYNRPAKDGDEFTEEGVYTVTVKNLYTDSQPTVKTIYVGTNPYLKALAKYNLSIDELNEQIRNGSIVKEDGLLTNTTLEARQ